MIHPFRSGRSPGAAIPVLGDERQRLVDFVHGKHYNDVLLGRVFSSTTTPLGLAIPIYTGTAPLGNVLWNPAGSGVNVELIAYNAARASGTSAVFSAGLMYRKVRQSEIATGANITAFAETTPVNALLGGGLSSQIKSSNAGTVTVAAGVAAEFIRNLFATGAEADATTNGAKSFQVDFDGTLVLPPGGLLWVAGTLASVALFAQTWVWKEIPTAQ